MFCLSQIISKIERLLLHGPSIFRGGFFSKKVDNHHGEYSPPKWGNQPLIGSERWVFPFLRSWWVSTWTILTVHTVYSQFQSQKTNFPQIGRFITIYHIGLGLETNICCFQSQKNISKDFKIMGIRYDQNILQKLFQIR